MIKRIISLFVAIVLALPVLFTVALASDDDIQSISFEQICSLFDYLDVIEKNNISSNRLDEPITRAEFASYVAAFLKFDNTLIRGERYYIDVDKSHWAYSSVNYLLNMGYLSLPDDRLFRPEDNIELSEACKILLALLGYEDLACAKGGYPVGYSTVAKELGMLKGLSSDRFTYKDALKLLYSAAASEVYDVESIKANGDDGRTVYYTKRTDDTLLSVYHDIYFVRDVVNAANQISIRNNSAAADNKIVIGDIAMEIDGRDYYSFLGRNVNAFYKIDNVTDKTILVDIGLSERDKFISVDAEDCLGFDNSAYLFRYYDDGSGREKTVRIDRGLLMLRNGEVISENISSEFEISKGAIDFIDSDSNGEYDIVKLNSYKNIYVGPMSRENKYVIDYYDNSICVDMNDSDKDVYLYNQLGEGIDFDSITAGAILSVYESEKYVCAYLCNNAVTGVVSEISTADGREKIFVGNNAYELLNEEKQRYNLVIQPGTEYLLNLDISGRIAYAKPSGSGSMEYGYISEYDIGGSFGTELKLRVFTQDDGFKIIKCADKVRVDGTTRSSPDGIIAGLKAAKAKAVPQLIRYRLNSEEDICEIDTAYYDKAAETQSLIIKAPLSSYSCVAGPRMFGKNYTVSPSAVIFAVPPDNEIADSGDEMFSIINWNYFKTYGKYMVETYVLNEDDIQASVVVLKSHVSDNITSSSEFIVVKEITKCINDDSEDLYRIKGFEDAKEITRDADAHYHIEDLNLSAGDIIRYTTDAKGHICKAELVYDCSSGNMSSAWTNENEFSAFDADNRLSLGYPVQIKNGVIAISYSEAKDEVSEVGQFTDTKVVVVDQSARKDGVYLSTSREIDYSDGSTDKVILRRKVGTIRWICVYKK